MTAPEMEKAVALLPCPFCGSEARSLSARVSEDCEEARVECTSCGAAGPADEDAYANHSAAASYWNRRVPLLSFTRQRDEIARLRAKFDWPVAPKAEQDAWIEEHWRDHLDFADTVLVLLSAAPECRAGERERALKIIADEERFAASDPPGNIELYALRIARVGTAKQILGDMDMSEPVTAMAMIPALSASPRSAEGWQALAEFARWAVREGVFEATTLDGADIESKAEKLGIVVRVAYDPAVHGDSDAAEPGDDWFVFADWLPAAPPVAEPGWQPFNPIEHEQTK